MDIVKKLKEYLTLTLGVEIKVLPWTHKTKLPFYLTDLYDFHEMTLLKQKCLLMILIGEDEMTPGTIEKHRENSGKLARFMCVCASQHFSAQSGSVH